MAQKSGFLAQNRAMCPKKITYLPFTAYSLAHSIVQLSEATHMTIRRSIALIVSAAALIAVAACSSSPTSPKGCDIVTNSSSTC
jgi:hypothetical protein